MSAAGITIIQSFTYRQAYEEFGNTYHFLGDAPTDETGWRALAGDLVDALLPIFPATVQAQRAYCYEDTDDDSVLTLTGGAEFTSALGTFTLGSGHYQAPGDAAMWIRWKTARTNSNGKPIYLRKYYHGVVIAPETGDGDLIVFEQRTALGTLASFLNSTTGDWPGIAGPDGVAPGASTHSQYATTRTLKRRGARPH